jgi:hypothetical protein
VVAWHEQHDQPIFWILINSKQQLLIMQDGKIWPNEAKATQLGPNGIHDRLARENETGVPGEELLVQRFLKSRAASLPFLEYTSEYKYSQNRFCSLHPAEPLVNSR